MAEEAKGQVPQAAESGGGQKSGSLRILVICNVVFMIFMIAIGVILYMDRQKQALEPTIEDVVKGEAITQAEEEASKTSFIGDVIPLETFIINLAGSRGRQVAKINMELEVDGPKVQEEIDKRKAQIRDIIIILLSSKTFDEVSTREGKDFLREEIKGTVNAFLTQGRIKRVYFTEFIYN